MPVMGAVNLPVVWSIPDPRRKAPLAGGWKYRKITMKQETDRFLGCSLRSSALPNSWTGFVKVIVTAGWRKKFNHGEICNISCCLGATETEKPPQWLEYFCVMRYAILCLFPIYKAKAMVKKIDIFLLADRQKIFAEFDKKCVGLQSYSLRNVPLIGEIKRRVSQVCLICVH